MNGAKKAKTPRISRITQIQKACGKQGPGSLWASLEASIGSTIFPAAALDLFADKVTAGTAASGPIV